eukprot:NODE_1177_length_1060_cov_227.788328_g900_i0.p1 GENE.NODE_1177_length_1060_cov_227.788328_g900_i0~~NODE_1177_length_1060_cov_227.788328_g900_i0.p1  ORF type:complete len:243 (-),score=11.14 NODE_1177_length_1060_cov_227.788328_g900_i0:278-1006(-)
MCRDNELFDSAPQDCICSIGHGVMTDPVMIMVADCEHEFCNTCIREWLRSSGDCPTCRRKFAESDLRSLRKTRLRIYDLECFCDSKLKGCDWTGKFGMLQEHMTQCRKGPRYMCPVSKYGCDQGPLDSTSMDEHMISQQKHHLNLCMERLLAVGHLAEREPSATRLAQHGGLSDEQLQAFQQAVETDASPSEIAERFRSQWPDLSWTILRCLKEDCDVELQSVGFAEVQHGYFTYTLVANRA